MGRIAILFLAAAMAFGQDAALVRLKQELKTAREQADEDGRKASVVLAKTGKWPDDERERSAGRIEHIQAILAGWIATRLPKGPNAAAISSSDWQSATERELVEAGIGLGSEVDPNSGPPPFTGVRVRLSWKPELSDLLLVIAGVGVGCGEDEALYAFRFDANGWARVIADHASSFFGYGSTEIEVSDADPEGRRLLLARRWSVQCASTWMTTAYSVLRVSQYSQIPAVVLLSGDHDFWMGTRMTV